MSTGCSRHDDFAVLSRDNFATNVFKKEASQFIQFDFNSLTEKQRTELDSFRKLSNSIATANLGGNNGILSRSIAEGFHVNTSDMDQSSPLVKIINAMSDPEVASAIQNKDINRYLSLLEQKGAISKKLQTRATPNNTSLQEATDESFFWVYAAAVAVVAAAYVAVVADVVIIGSSTSAEKEAHLQETISSSIMAMVITLTIYT